MSLIPKLADIPDLSPVAAGEYDLRIIKAQETKSKRTGRYGTLFIIDILGEDNADNIMHTVWFGNYKDFQDDDDDKNIKMWRMVKEFIKSLGLDPEEDLEAEDFVDVEFTALVTYNDGMSIDEDGNPVKLGAPRNELGKIL